MASTDRGATSLRAVAELLRTPAGEPNTNAPLGSGASGQYGTALRVPALPEPPAYLGAIARAGAKQRLFAGAMLGADSNYPDLRAQDAGFQHFAALGAITIDEQTPTRPPARVGLNSDPGSAVIDILPPIFGGATSAVVQDATTVRIGWTQGTDDATPQAQLVYEMHWSTLAGQPFVVRAVSAAGVAFHDVLDLSPNQTYFFRARCRDRQSNINANAGSEFQVTPNASPTFSGASSAVAIANGVRVSWSAASDDKDLAASIKYAISLSTVSGAPFQQNFLTAAAATQYDVTGLIPGVTYYFKVRAVDTNGAMDGNNFQVSTIVTNNPPTFSGVTAAVSTDGRTALVSWTQGTDDNTAQGSLVYEVHISTVALASFATRAVSSPGVSNTTITGLTPQKRYYVKVRCRDGQGNLDTNTVEISFLTPDDPTAHPVIGNISPAPNTAINVNQSIQFDVTDASSSFRRVIVAVTQANSAGVEEIIHDGDAFRGYFAGTSSRTVISGGYRFAVLRSGGWQGAPTFRVYAVTTDGFENP